MQNRKITIIGAGASGLFCAGLLGQAGFDVTIIDNGKKLGRKILMSGGGRCNFTNINIDAQHYLSANPHFCKSAIKRYTQWDFLALVNQYHIAYHEKESGQLFCDDSAQQIVAMLESECQKGNVKYCLQTELLDVERSSSGFNLHMQNKKLETDKLIVATGGLSMPALGMTPIGYKIAEKFHLPVEPIRAGLVPLTLQKSLLDILSPLAGLSVWVTLSLEYISFTQNMLFTHRGLSGPAVLQISNYWQNGMALHINLLPEFDIGTFLQTEKQSHPNQSIKNTLAKQLPKRLVECLILLNFIPDILLKQLSEKQQIQLIKNLTDWQIIPNGTEGYRTAEVTLGGVSTEVLSSKTMAVKTIPNLYFIGEVIDVSGWLGGYNFQWAWSSAYACAQSIIDEETHCKRVDK